MSTARARAAVLALLLAACGGVERPPSAPVAPREAPLPELPVASAAASVAAPPDADVDAPPQPVVVARHRGAAGLVAISVVRAVEVTDVRVIVRGAGLAADPALARAAGASLSSRLRSAPLPHAGRVEVTVGLDALVIAFASTDPAASLRALGPSLRGVDGRDVELDLPAPPDGDVALFRALFRLPTSVHPYAELAPPAALARPRDVARFADARFVSDAIAVVSVGVVDAATAHDALAQSLGVTRAAPPIARPTPPVSPDGPRLFVVDASTDAPLVTVGLTALDRGDDAWPELVLATRARREHLRATIPAFDASLTPVRDGPCPLIARWRSSPRALVDEVRAVLSSLPPDAPPPPAAAEVRAERSLLRDHAMVAGQPRRLADRLAELVALGRDDAPAAPTRPAKPRLPRSLAEQPPSSPVVVVVADAAAVGQALSALGDVTVLDPRRALSPSRVVKATP